MTGQVSTGAWMGAKNYESWFAADKVIAIIIRLY